MVYIVDVDYDVLLQFGVVFQEMFGVVGNGVDYGNCQKYIYWDEYSEQVKVFGVGQLELDGQYYKKGQYQVVVVVLVCG